MYIFIADPGADCFSPCPLPKIDKAANECRRWSCYNFTVLKNSPRLGSGVMSFQEEREEKEKRGSLTPGEVK